MPARTGPNRCRARKGRAANHNRRRRHSNGAPSNANTGDDEAGTVRPKSIFTGDSLTLCA